MSVAPPVLNILSVDVEDYMFADPWRSGPATFAVSPQVGDETRRILDLLDELGAAATCFVVGCVAKALPGLVREIAVRGHEVAAHGYHHVRMRYLSPQAFREDLAASVATLEDITGRAIRGFRAPGFSLRSAHAWAFEIMVEAGIVYDSSVRLTWPTGVGASSGLLAKAAIAGIREVPGFKLGIGRVAVPLGGGGGLRVLPASVTTWAIRRINRRGLAVPIYLHPYDMATERASGPWYRPTRWGRTAMAVTHALQRAGRSQVADHLREVARISGVTTMDDYVRQAPSRWALTPGPVTTGR